MSSPGPEKDTRFSRAALNIGRILGLAGAYAVAGRLALFLAIPPGYATAIWPAAGIALAGVLVWGSRVWPGVLLGSFLVNVWTSFDPTDVASVFASLAMPFAIGLGAALQAVVGAFLVRRFVGFPNLLEKEKDIFRFLVLGGPVSCLVSSIFGATLLRMRNLISASDYAFHWGTWWAGDTIGVLIFAPLVLIWSVVPRASEWRRQLSVSLPLLLTFALAVAFFVRTRAYQQRNTQLDFERRSEQLSQAVRKAFDGYLEVLYSLRSFYAASATVEREEFRAFVGPFLPRHPGLLALSWNPRVSDSERAAWEEAARQEGKSSFQITQIYGDGRIQPATRRAKYFPTLYLENTEGNQKVIGFDVASEPVRRQALERARDMGEPIATGKLRLLQGPYQEAGVVVFVPIYHNGLPHETLADRRENLRGYVGGVFRVREMLQASLKGLHWTNIEIRLFDESAPAGQALLCAVAPAEGDTIRKPTDGRMRDDTTAFRWAARYEMAGRRWLLAFSSTPDYVGAQHGWQAWALLVTGLVFTSLLGSFLLVVTGHTQRIERLVAERTTALEKSKAKLEQDIAERRRAEETLQRSEEKYRSLFDFAPIGIYRLRRDGRLLTVNATLAKMLGYDSPEDLLQVNLKEICVDSQEQEALLARTELLGPGSAQRIELVWKRRDGTPIWIETGSYSVADETGAPDYSEGFVHDVTERRRSEVEKKNLEGQLIQSQKMEAVGQLAGGIAHDFNNLMTAVTGYSDLLVADLPIGDRRRAHAEEIRRAGQKAASLTQQLLALSRRQVLEPKVFDLNSCVTGLEGILRRLIGEDIQIVTRKEPNLWIRSDPAQIDQAVLNLAINARDAMPAGGTLTIETANVQFGGAESHPYPFLKPGGYAMIALHDTGVGMSPEVKGRIFEPFFTTKEPGKGTGLGLSTTYGIVKQSGGYILCETAPGRGSTFRVYLPRVDEPSERLGPAPVPESARRGEETILLVEDEPEVRSLLQKLLKMQGYTVISAANPDEALSICRLLQKPIDLLVSDVILPHMSGRELARRLAPSRPDLKVLYISGYTNDAILDQGMLETGTAFLQKPFGPEALGKKIRQVLEAPPGLYRVS